MHRCVRLPIPLREGDPEVQLELQPLIEAVYENGRYAERLDYTQALYPPLESVESDFCQQTLRNAGLLT